MTIKELRETLSLYPDDLSVFFQETWDYYEDFPIMEVYVRRSSSNDLKNSLILSSSIGNRYEQ